MAYTDTLSGTITASIQLSLATDEGNVEGKRQVAHIARKVFSDGTGNSQATGFFSTTFTATTGGITISLADSADPLGAAGDDTPTSDPEGTELRALLIENLDASNYISVTGGSNALTNWATGTIVVQPTGVFLLTFPNGKPGAINDGADDEITVTANTASCSVKITYVFG